MKAEDLNTETLRRAIASGELYVENIDPLFRPAIQRKIQQMKSALRERYGLPQERARKKRAYARA